MHRILIFDEAKVAHETTSPETASLETISLDSFLSASGFGVLRDSSLNIAATTDADLVLLAQELPPANCNQVLRALRESSEIPVIVLSQNADTMHRVVALELGADDYLTKPVDQRELLARIRSVLRRAHSNRHPSAASQVATPNMIGVGDIQMFVESRRVLQSGADVQLTSLEFDLLRLLLDSVGQSVSRKQISESILGRQLTRQDRSIDVHISGLRKKLGHKFNGVGRIRTVRGVGYIYTMPFVGSTQSIADNVASG